MILKLSRLATFLTTAFTLAILPGCHSPEAKPPVDKDASTPQAAVTVRVGYFPNVTHAPAVLGFAAGEHAFATALGARAKLETKVFNAGPSAMEALHAGAIDLTFVGPTPAINAFAKGGDLTIVANVANGGSVLVARKGSGIAKVADLDGKRIAVPQLGNTQDAMLRHLLAQASIKLKDQGGKTTVLPVENPNVQSLFTTGQLDAACVPEPWGARLETESGASVVLDWKPIWRDGDYPVTVLVARKAFLDQHRDIVKTFVEALQTLTDRLSAKSGADVAALNAELKVLTGKELKPEVISKALGRIEFTTRVNPESLQAMAEVMHEVGYAKTVPDVTGLIDSSLLPAQGKDAPSGK